PTGQLVRKYRVLYVQRADALKVTVAADRPEYRPGQKASLRLRVRDRSDQPVPGALSLAAVDAAVFGVGKGPAAIDLDDRSEVLRPVQTWAPGMKLPGTPEQQTRITQALFARAASDERSADREALKRQLLPFLDNNPRLFQVLDRPDWEQLTNVSWMPEN